MKATITLKEYLQKKKTFVIPDYQRGYVWGKNHGSGKNSVENLIDDFTIRFKNQTEIFLQGVTATETHDEIILIDGQQRTTCLYLLLKFLGYQGMFSIRYEVRKASGDFLKTINFDAVEENPKEEYQDVFYFKKTLRIIQEKLANIDKYSFLEYILNNVKFLYINVPSEQAPKVFTMMNGNKAEMQHEEIIKAEILRLASLNNDHQIDYAQEWEHNMLRSRYAREWDKWLHWWNDDCVQSLFRCHNNMGLLISSYLHQQTANSHTKTANNLTYENFKTICLSCDSPKEAKQTFDGLRRLQKRFEDAFNDPVAHNMIGAILRIFDQENKKKFICHYFVEDNRENLEDYYKLVFLGMTHDEIKGKDKKKFADKYDMTFKAINDDYVYLTDNKEFAFRLLLRLNVDQDILQGRKFNFIIWEERSLEHIMPKSKVGHRDEANVKWLDGNDQEHDCDDFPFHRDDIKTEGNNGTVVSTTEHGIGNLVLLYKNENSKFNDSDFLKKKELFFNPQKKELFKSRHLLHTICVFAEKEGWDGASIAANKMATIEKFESDYNDLKKKFEYEKQD